MPHTHTACITPHDIIRAAVEWGVTCIIQQQVKHNITKAFDQHPVNNLFASKTINHKSLIEVVM
jgi:hypothetical protein